MSMLQVRPSVRKLAFIPASGLYRQAELFSFAEWDRLSRAERHRLNQYRSTVAGFGVLAYRELGDAEIRPALAEVEAECERFGRLE